MNMQSLNKNKKKLVVKILNLVLMSVISLILPIIIYINALSWDASGFVSTYISRLKLSVIWLIILGIIIIILKTISFFIRPISKLRLIITFSIGVIYILYIIISAYSEIIEIAVAWIYLKIDLSFFSLLLLPVPILAMIRNMVDYIYTREEINCKLIILNTLSYKNLGSKQSINKSILKNKEINLKIKRIILKNFKEIMYDLETSHPHLLFISHGKYRMTKAGRNFFKHYGNGNFKKEKPLNILEVWTEAELEKFAHNRRLKI